MTKRSWLGLCAALAAVGPAHAQDAAPPSPAAEALDEAKKLFRQGVAMRKAQDHQRALEYFRESRALVPSVPNTINVAFCLEQLGRAAEALEVYEELLTEFAESVTEEERADIAASMASLRPKVGSLLVSANVPALLVIDGRMRGELPRTAPIRIMPGSHVVRVMKDGYEPFERTIEIRAGQSLDVDAKLQALREAGRLRVEAEGEDGAALYVDGARIGTLPWEGTLSAGRHYYFIRTADGRGSAPAAIDVVAGQTVLARAAAKPLTGELRVLVSPPSAELSINGLSLGRGQWQGRLPIGEHALEAREEGYRSRRVKRSFAGSASGDVRLDLPVDPDHPRWRTDESEIFFEGFGAFALSPGFSSGAEDSCSAASVSCSRDGAALGGLVGARAGYGFPIDVAVELAGGYLGLAKDFRRDLGTSFDDPVSGAVGVAYDYEQTLQFNGPFASVGLAYRAGVSDRFAIDARAHFGALFATTRSPVRVEASTARDAGTAFVEGAGRAQQSVAPLLMPSVQARYRIGAVDLLAGVTGIAFLVEGPTGKNGGTFPEGASGCPRPGQPGSGDSVACAPGDSTFASERTYGRFFTIAPHVGIAYAL